MNKQRIHEVIFFNSNILTLLHAYTLILFKYNSILSLIALDATFGVNPGNFLRYDHEQIEKILIFPLFCDLLLKMIGNVNSSLSSKSSYNLINA